MTVDQLIKEVEVEGGMGLPEEQVDLIVEALQLVKLVQGMVEKTEDLNSVDIRAYLAVSERLTHFEKELSKQ